MGLQLLATMGFEHGQNPGLNWIRGTVERIKMSDDNAMLRVPHIGWNEVRFERKDGLYARMGESQSFYFVHSFVLKPSDLNIVSGLCDYGADFVASIEFENIAATQFHPEKSHKAGLAVLRNWCDGAMLKKRLIPVLLLQNGLLVRSELFKIHQIIGNPDPRGRTLQPVDCR